MTLSQVLAVGHGLSLLVDATLRGTSAAMAVVLLDRAVARTMAAKWRRLWWLLIPVAFLMPLRVPIWNRSLTPLAAIGPFSSAAALHPLPPELQPLNRSSFSTGTILAAVWAAGAAIYLAVVIAQTVMVSRRWSRARLSTDHRLLELLEDCKAEVGILVPIGLVVSGATPAPAILGWLRPRILLSPQLAEAAPDCLRAVLLHELAHFRWWDVPCGWLMTAARAVHWFNPIAHWVSMEWSRFREEAADEAAAGWLNDANGQIYGAALLHTLRLIQPNRTPFGALAIIESHRTLKRRMTMIARYSHRPSRPLLAVVLAAAVATAALAGPSDSAGLAESTERAAATAAMLPWLKEVDAGKYAASWNDASVYFKERVTSQDWVVKVQTVRVSLGRCKARTLASALLQPNVLQSRDVVTAQFHSTFENLASAMETVSFVQEKDGSWKVVGYYVKPG